jgi:hypothetical protein
MRHTASGYSQVGCGTGQGAPRHDTCTFYLTLARMHMISSEQVGELLSPEQIQQQPKQTKLTTTCVSLGDEGIPCRSPEDTYILDLLMLGFKIRTGQSEGCLQMQAGHERKHTVKGRYFRVWRYILVEMAASLFRQLDSRHQ